MPTASTVATRQNPTRSARPPSTGPQRRPGSVSGRRAASPLRSPPMSAVEERGEDDEEDDTDGEREVADNWEEAVREGRRAEEEAASQRRMEERAMETALADRVEARLMQRQQEREESKSRAEGAARTRPAPYRETGNGREPPAGPEPTENRGQRRGGAGEGDAATGEREGAEPARRNPPWNPHGYPHRDRERETSPTRRWGGEPPGDGWARRRAGPERDGGRRDDERPRHHTMEVHRPITVVSDGLGASASGLPSVLSLAQAPKLLSVDRAAVVKFLDEWAVYQTKTAGATVGRVRLRTTVRPKDLRAWCSYNPALSGYEATTIPDDVLYDFLQTVAFPAEAKVDDTPIDAMEKHLRAKVRFNTRIEDHAMRVDTFLADFDEEVRINGWQQTFGTASSRGKKINKLLAGMLWPPKFVGVVKSAAERMPREPRTIAEFRALVLKCSPLLDGILMEKRGDPRQTTTTSASGRAGGGGYAVGPRGPGYGRSTNTTGPRRFGGVSTSREPRYASSPTTGRPQGPPPTRVFVPLPPIIMSLPAPPDK